MIITGPTLETIANAFWAKLPEIIVAAGAFLKLMHELRKTKAETREIKTELQAGREELKENTLKTHEVNAKTEEVRTELRENTNKTVEIATNTNGTLSEIRTDLALTRKELQAERETNASKITMLEQMVELLKEDRESERTRSQVLEARMMADMNKRADR